jgi:hypothetical protein
VVRALNPATRIQISAGPFFELCLPSFLRWRLETVLTVMVISSLNIETEKKKKKKEADWQWYLDASFVCSNIQALVDFFYTTKLKRLDQSQYETQNNRV